MEYPDFKDLTIKEIKKYCDELEVNDELLEIASVLNEDSRSGVKKIAERLKRKLVKKRAIIDKWHKMAVLEEEMFTEGYQTVVGIDEAGRGPLAGPVVAAAVLLDPNKPIYGLDDSKKLSRKKREKLLKEINNKAYVGVGKANSREIDQFNIREATFTAMKRAVKDLLAKLDKKPDLLIVDGNAEIPALSIEQKTVVNGDAEVNAVAAASIAAKVHRDNIIFKYAEEFPEYKFRSNKGYGTAQHIEALKKYGASPIHRRSFGRVPD